MFDFLMKFFGVIYLPMHNLLIRNDKINDEATLGHDMVNTDLKNCLIIMKTKITNREFNRAMNKDDGKPSDDLKKKQELKV